MKVQVFSRHDIRRPAVLAGLVILVLGIASCGGSGDGPVKQAPPVTVGQPVQKAIQEYSIFTGSTRAVEAADIVARVSGTLETVEFEPGSKVKAGDLLFTIEETSYRAARDAAVAALHSAEADLLRAETELKRVEKASRSRAVSEMDVDRSRAERDMAKARVASAKANLDEAELKLSYTKVTSPIDGIVSRNYVDAGNLVGKEGATLLTRVNKVQPIYVYFHAPESAVLKFLAARKDTARMKSHLDSQEDRARIELANETGFPHSGTIDFIDNQVDARTGTIEVRLRLENKDMSLFPGLFTRIKVYTVQIPDAVLVPEVAVGSDLGGKYVLVVGEDNIVEQIYVELGSTQDGGLVHIRKGLEGGETIIVNGLMFARPGMPVTPLTPEQFEAMKKQQAAKD